MNTRHYLIQYAYKYSFNDAKIIGTMVTIFIDGVEYQTIHNDDVTGMSSTYMMRQSFEIVSEKVREDIRKHRAFKIEQVNLGM